MTRNPGVKDYHSMQILSAKPERLIIMLYDGAMRFVQMAIKSAEENDIETAHINLVKTQNILVELMASLNFEKGGEVAVNLFRIYEFMHYTLVQANLNKEAEPMRKICDQLKKLRESWAQAIKNEEKAGTNAGSGNGKPGNNDNGKSNIELTG